MIGGATRSGFFLAVAGGYRLFVGIDEPGVKALVEGPVEHLEFEGLEQGIGSDGSAVEAGKHGRKARTKVGGRAGTCLGDHGNTFTEGVRKTGKGPALRARTIRQIIE